MDKFEWPKLTAEAKIGNATFGIGVSSRLVVECAQRQAAYAKEEAAWTPERANEEERRRREMWDLLHGPVGLTVNSALAEMEARKDAAYLERNQVVAALAKCFPSGVARTAIEGWSEDWHGCVYIDLPTGQVSWHFHDSEAYLFSGLPEYKGEWDGHDTPEKYRRLAILERDGTPENGDNHKLDNDHQVFFYENDFYVLSNFSSFSLEWRGRKFPTVEHAYHWLKFPYEEALQKSIEEAPSAHEAFKLAQENKHRRRADWDSVKVSLMRRLLHAKVMQHEYVHYKLMQTGYRELIEDSWRDDFWGWGPDRKGQNMLGKLWMIVRDDVRDCNLHRSCE